MLRTEIGERVLAGEEAKLFAETLLGMLDLEIGMGECNPAWNPVFCGLTH